MKIGVVGYSSGTFDEDLAAHMLEIGFEYMMLAYSDSEDFDIVTGLTNVGIPGIAYSLAAEQGWRTVGIACEKAKEYECFPVDEEIIVGDEWGDESQIFIDYVDCLVRVGGSEQSIVEVAEFRKQKPQAYVIEMDLPREED